MAAHYTHIEVQPMAGALGADVHGVDLAQPLDDATFAEIERAFHDRLVLFFHDQRLTPEQHVAFSRRLGPLSRSPYVKHMAERSEEHTSELQSLMRTSYAVFCLNKNT